MLPRPAGTTPVPNPDRARSLNPADSRRRYSPDAYELSPDCSDGTINDLSGEVREIIYQGDSALVIVRVGVDQDISVRVPTSRVGAASIPEVATRIGLGLHAEDTIIVPESAL